MNKIEKPFSESAYSKMMRTYAEYELMAKQLDDVKFLRDRISKGQLTTELYDFINADGTMEKLLPCIPRPCDDMACESLSIAQLESLTETIGKMSAQLEGFLGTIWESTGEWLADWFDRSRKLRFAALDLRAKVTGQTYQYFGDHVEFAGASVLMYHKDQWVKMYNAARNIVNEVKRIPASANFIQEWITSARNNISKDLEEFGMYINENGSICKGALKYIRQENTCATLGWRLDHLAGYLDYVAALIGDEVAVRKDINNLKMTFMSNNGNTEMDRRDMYFIRDAVVAAKKTSMAVGNTLVRMVNQVIQQHVAMKRIAAIKK